MKKKNAREGESPLVTVTADLTPTITAVLHKRARELGVSTSHWLSVFVALSFGCTHDECRALFWRWRDLPKILANLHDVKSVKGGEL